MLRILLGALRQLPSLSCLGLVLAATFITPVSAQLAQPRAELEAFAASVINDDSPSSGQLDLYVQVPYSKLEFQSGPDGFTARYSIRAEVSLLDRTGRPLSVTQAPVWDQSVTVPVHAETQSLVRFDLTTHTITLQPGSYLIAVQLSDEYSRKNFFREIASTVRAFDRPLGLSDVVLLDDYEVESQTLTPRVSADIPPTATELSFHYEVYSQSAQTVVLTEELLSESQMAGQAIAQYSSSDTVYIAAGTHYRLGSMPVSDLDAGRYRLRVTMLNSGGHVQDTVELPVAARWAGLDEHLGNLDEAIAQLAYISPGRELGAMRRAPSEAERLAMFREFWEKRDPTPGTARNERMEEHYYRIHYANRHFGRNQPGWLTDRGQVFVLHGHPDDVQRQVYSYNNRPWEVWYFYALGRQFVFVDKTGFGDYELVVPMWDDRTRLD